MSAHAIGNKHGNLITEGPVLKALLIVALPIIFSNLLQNVLELVDIYCIGNFVGEDAAAAGTTGASVIMLLLVLVFGINTATAAFVARAYGSHKHERISVILGHALYATMGLSLIIGIIGFFFTEQIFVLFGAEPGVIEQGVAFLRPVLVCMFIMVLLMVLVTVFQSAGDSKTPMFVMIIVNVVNIVLNPTFIAGFGLGIAGSAYASIISRAVGVVLLILAMYFLPSKKNGPIKFPKKWTFEGRLLRDLVLIALPSALQSGLRSFSFVGMTAIITIFGGTAAMAAYGICGRLDMMGFILVMGLCTGVAVMVGQNLGARKPERAMKAAKSAILINAAFMVCLGVFYFFCAPTLMEIFGATGEWLAYGVEFMHIVPVSYFVVAAGMTMGFAMNGAGVTRPGMYAALAGNIIVQVGLSLVFMAVLHLPLYWVWIAIVLGGIVTTAVDAFFFFRGKWMRKELNLDAV
ncbi:MAG: MATE family efflux transporter [Methanocorpusculum sp.]|nr:MATE family efflux transporter [Methanocorpusculum sp.]